LDASLYTLLQIFSFSLFEKASINQALDLKENTSDTSQVNKLLNLFDFQPDSSELASTLISAATGLTDGVHLRTAAAGWIRVKRHIYPSDKDRRHTKGVKVRVIDYRLVGVADAEPIYRLVTTTLDPMLASAEELARRSITSPGLGDRNRPGRIEDL
jgi:hypothetical protein